MADEEQDPLAFITDNCRYSSSQEELLSHAKFAREDEIFPDEEDSPEAADAGVSRRKLDGADDSEGKCGGESAAGVADSAAAENLGFRGERKGESSGTKLEGVCGGEGEIEPQLKKYKVSPLVHCTGKMVIDGEDDGGKVVVFSGDLKVEKVSSLQAVVPESAGCTEKLSCEGDDVDIEGETRVESGAKKKLEFELETEVINAEEEGGIGEKGNVDKEGEVDGEGSGKAGDDEKQGDGMSTKEEEEEDTTGREKRELPRSMFGLVWGEGTGDVIGNGDVEGGLKDSIVEGKKDGESKGVEEEAVCGEGSDGDAIENAVVGNDNVEKGLKEDSVGETRDGNSKGGEEEAISCILDILRVIVSEKYSDDDAEFDILETAKRRGMTFPRSRFLPEAETDE